MNFRIKKVNPYKLGTVFALLYGVLSVFIFLIAAMLGVVSGQPVAWWMIFLFPILYSIAGFIGGLVLGAIYNLVAKWVGGVEVETEEIEKFSE